jgi:sugar-specific transcriptional regulator TrmB
MTTIEEKIKELENQIEELKKEYKKEEMEELFKSVLNDLKIEIDDNEPNLIFYKKNGKVVFRLYYDLINKERCDYNLVWSIFHNKYNLNYDETQAFIERMVEKHLKLSKVTSYHFGME